MRDRRLKFRENLSSLYLPFYDALCTELLDHWQPYSGMRSFVEQQGLYDKGRTTPGPRVTFAKAGQSAHNYGCATDWAPLRDDGTFYWPGANDRIWKEYLHALDKVGLRSGSDWGDYPHNELNITCDWTHVLLAYQQGGMIAAQQHIDANLS